MRKIMNMDGLLQDYQLYLQNPLILLRMSLNSTIRKELRKFT